MTTTANLPRKDGSGKGIRANRGRNECKITNVTGQGQCQNLNLGPGLGLGKGLGRGLGQNRNINRSVKK